MLSYFKPSKSSKNLLRFKKSTKKFFSSTCENVFLWFKTDMFGNKRFFFGDF